jgi:hypothetical protein
MSTIKSRLAKAEQRLGPAPAPDAIDWPALIAHIAKHGRRLFRMDGDV